VVSSSRIRRWTPGAVSDMSSKWKLLILLKLLLIAASFYILCKPSFITH
jgi:hypothetical protein